MIPYRERLESFDGRIITRQTISEMHEQVRLAKSDWAWIELATWIVRGVPSKDYSGEAKRLFDVFHFLIWDAGYFRYRRDPHQVETVESPWHVLDRRASDCDGWAVFYASLVGAVGCAYRFKTINANPARPHSPSHVYDQVLIPGRGWVSADLTVKEAYFGWEPKGFPSQVWLEPKYQ